MHLALHVLGKNTKTKQPVSGDEHLHRDAVTTCILAQTASTKCWKQEKKQWAFVTCVVWCQAKKKGFCFRQTLLRTCWFVVTVMFEKAMWTLRKRFYSWGKRTAKPTQAPREHEGTTTLTTEPLRCPACNQLPHCNDVLHHATTRWQSWVFKDLTEILKHFPVFFSMSKTWRIRNGGACPSNAITTHSMLIKAE